MSKVADIHENLEYGPAPENANLATKWLEDHNRSFGIYVGGQWLEPEKSFPSLNPANGKEIAQISQTSEERVSQAVQSASKALKDWQALSCEKRGQYLYAIARQIQKHSRLFAVLESLDNGKPIRETRDIDIPLVVRHFYYHAGQAILRDQKFPDYSPVGVCGQIIPWNFPLLMLAWKIAPALAMGNTVVLKPAEFTSLTALLFAEICHEVGIPSGVVNIITGDGTTGKALVENKDVAKIAFTGSTEVGRIIRKATASTNKKLSLELGGKSPFVVFEDADLDSAVEGIVDAIWFNQGQVCCAGSRLLIQESIAEKFYEKVRTRMDKLRVGDPLDKAVDLGAIVDRSQLETISGLVERGVKEGATKYQSPCDLPADGFYYPPTLLTDVEPSSTVVQQEIFGPVLVAMTFRTPEEAVKLSNNTVYGLASSVWTQNLDIAHDMASQIKAGTVWVNCTNQFDASAGFGGFRESGYGREGGEEGLYEYLKWNQPKGSNSTETTTFKSTTSLDRTHKLYIGGKQARPDGGYSLSINGEEFARGNRKDIRNAVEVATNAQNSWSKTPAFTKSQILYYLAENLSAAREIMIQSLGGSEKAKQEFEFSLSQVMHYAAWADKYEGTIHQVPARMHVYTRPEAIGVMGVVCPDEAPLLSYLSLCLPLISMGNSIVSLPSEKNPLPAVELMRIIEASDIPAGVWNIITGIHSEMVRDLAGHTGVDGIWHFGDQKGGFLTQQESISNLKQTWLGAEIDWEIQPHLEFLRRATQVKNVWVPYGF